MDSSSQLAFFDPDNSTSTLIFDTVTFRSGSGSIQLGVTSTGSESKIKANLSSLLSLWAGTKLNVWVYLPDGSNVSNIGVYMFADPNFVWIDYAQIMGPFATGAWNNVSIPLTAKQINAASFSTNGQQIWLGLTFFSANSLTNDAIMNLPVNLNGISIVP